MLIDAIIVLGKGVAANGLLPKVVQHELDYVLALHLEQQPLVIVSGRHWGLAAPGKLSEAAAMAKYLRTRANIKVQLEDQSLDTIGNLVFSKQLCDAKQAKRILIISTVGHLARVQQIARWVFGDDYQLTYHGHQHLYTPLQHVHRYWYEQWSLWYMHWFFWKWQHAGKPEPTRFIQQHHFMYRRNRLVTWFARCLLRVKR